MRPVNTWYMELRLVNLVYSLTVNLKKKEYTLKVVKIHESVK